MLKNAAASSVSRWAKAAMIAVSIWYAACDRGASEQIYAAKEFSDAVVTNNAGKRDSMIATYIFKDYFHNQYVAADFIGWFGTFYNMQEKKFIDGARADVDRNLKSELDGALIDAAPIEATGMVKARSPQDPAKSAYFWMVKQEGRPWRVAMVTKGEMIVKFKPDAE
jgi:hypothetical protein